MQVRAKAGERSLTDVLIDIGQDVQDILRAEIRLAQWEMRERLQSAGALIALGVIASLLCAFFVLLAVLYGLRMLMPPWAAALCIAAGTALGAFVALSSGIARLRRRSAEHIKEELRWRRQLRK
jgi:VIT1/CCC1 family predicted Fe2+/Mn2+ transporter